MTQESPRPTSCERWLHVPTNIVYRVTFEVAGVVDLEPLHGKTLQIRRDVLSKSEAWQLIP